MMRNRLSPSRGRADLRARWAEHLAAQRKSGQTQGTYCRAQGLDPKYFTPWKGKLQSIAVASASRMVSAVVVLSAQPTVSAMPETVREAGFGWRRGACGDVVHRGLGFQLHEDRLLSPAPRCAAPGVCAQKKCCVGQEDPERVAVFVGDKQVQLQRTFALRGLTSTHEDEARFIQQFGFRYHSKNLTSRSRSCQM